MNHQYNILVLGEGNLHLMLRKSWKNLFYLIITK
jgi:hypothetical protein